MGLGDELKDWDPCSNLSTHQRGDLRALSLLCAEGLWANQAPPPLTTEAVPARACLLPTDALAACNMLNQEGCTEFLFLLFTPAAKLNA